MASVGERPHEPALRRRPYTGKPVPAEGENGLFSQTWYPICLSGEVETGTVIGRQFLDGRIIVYRGKDGVAHVHSAYCAHLGADLVYGDVVGNNVRCPFHKWQYDGGGRCVKTGSGDPPPPRAHVFDFPTAEKWGLVWAFNGDTPLFEVPMPPKPDGEKFYYRTLRLHEDYTADPWVVMSNPFDFQHLKLLHGVEFNGDEPDEDIDWGQYAASYDMRVSVPGKDTHGLVVKQVVLGTNILMQYGVTGGRYSVIISPFGLTRPGHSVNHLILATTLRSGSDEEIAEAEAFLDQQETVGRSFQSEDNHILMTARFRVGALTRSCRAIGKYLEWVRRYPRAHPSAEYIK